jgi:hypothetical protein
MGDQLCGLTLNASFFGQMLKIRCLHTYENHVMMTSTSHLLLTPGKDTWPEGWINFRVSLDRDASKS